MSPQTSLWKNGEFMTDVWQLLDSETAVPKTGFVIFGKQRWLAEREHLIGSGLPVGLRLEAGEAFDDIAEDLTGFAVIALDFPAFTDGRAYSTARVLRDQYGYRGELRAAGDVLLDQIALMLRVGFDTFAITHAPTVKALRDAPPPDVPLYLQPAIGPTEAPEGSRPWARRVIG